MKAWFKRQGGVAIFFWDLCVWLLVFFPLVTGGIWVRRPGFKIELTELGVPVLLVGLLAAVIHWGLGRDLRQASSWRVAENLWEVWRRALERNPRKVLWFGTGCVSLIFSLVSLRRHWAFESGAEDLGLFVNALWNLVFRSEYISSVKEGMNLFVDHQSPLFWLFAPVFRIQEPGQ